MNPFRITHSNLTSGIQWPQGEVAFLAATLLACAAHFDAVSPDPFATGKLANPYRECVRRMELLNMPAFAVKAFATRLEPYALRYSG